MVDKIWYNMEELIGGYRGAGINRNIVECKDCFQAEHLRRVSRINRNIVECKGIRQSTTRNSQRVLIET